MQLRTDRLRLRRWQPADSAPFAAMSADPRVMEYLPSLLRRDESDAIIARMQRHVLYRITVSGKDEPARP